VMGIDEDGPTMRSEETQSHLAAGGAVVAPGTTPRSEVYESVTDKCQEVYAIGIA
jgi:hypothetical protein